MIKLTKNSVLFSSIFLVSVSSFAKDEVEVNFSLKGSHSALLPIKNQLLGPNDKNFNIDSIIGTKTIKLMTIEPTANMIQKNKNALATMKANGGELDYTSGIIPFANSPGAVDLGMSNVPVLDQGAYGTCVTFSTTAAIDAKFNLGDYIDQQCSLALDNTLGNNYWDGAYMPSNIIDPIVQNGIIYKNSCFSSVYPDPTQLVNIQQYQSQSYQGYANYLPYVYESTPSLDEVKKALNNGNRVLIATFLSDTDDYISVDGFDMTINMQKTTGGLWACQQPGNATNYCALQQAGHEIVVIGYDDKQRLLKIRNSWSDAYGDNGDFYMTYEFFSAMVTDHTEILQN